MEATIKFEEGKYYLGTDGVKVEGWLQIDGYWYYFDPVFEGCMTVGEAYLDQEFYVFDDNGRMLDGSTITMCWIFLISL